MKEFCGHPVDFLDNGKIRVEYLASIGPRIARLFIANSEANFLAEVPDLGADTSFGRFQFMGGHRLWHAPEAFPRSYIPDQPISCEKLARGVRLVARAEPETGIAKSMEIQLAVDKASLTIDHILGNEGSEETVLAPWALTMFKLGGTAILPQPDERENTLLPNRLLAVWPYTLIDDKRIRWGDDYILVDAQPALPPIKVGNYNSHGWAAYWIDGTLIVKSFAIFPSAGYPDMGCNVETYCSDRFIELETLAPLTKLAPGNSVVHRETWDLYDSLHQPFIPAPLLRSLEA